MKTCYCGKQRVERRLQNQLFLYCSHCGFLSKKMRLSLEKQKERYDCHVCDDSYIQYMRQVKNGVLPYLVPYGRILDFGCGKIHALADELCKDGIECYYYDLFFYPHFPSGKFQTIIMIEVFEHLTNPLLELEKCRNHLERLGRIIIQTQIYDEKILGNWWYLRDSTHIHFIRKDTFQKWKEKIGFQVHAVDGNIFVLERI